MWRKIIPWFRLQLMKRFLKIKVLKKGMSRCYCVWNALREERLNGTRFQLYLVGDPAPHHMSYFHECQKQAGNNIHFVRQVSQAELVEYYSKAKVHVLPSWFETAGLSSLEAAAMGCNVVITRKGDAHEYFGDEAEYCDPAS